LIDAGDWNSPSVSRMVPSATRTTTVRMKVASSKLTVDADLGADGGERGEGCREAPK
jgi:hypothetical protein